MSERTAPRDQPVDELSALKARVRELEQVTVKQQLAALELREREEQYRLLLAESPDPTFSFTPKGRYLFVNRAFAEGVGKPVEEIIGRTIWDVFPKEEADKRFASLSQVFRTGEEKVIEVRVPRPDADRHYLTTITPILDGKGSVSTAICCSKEITARKQTEETLRQSEELLRSLLEHSPISMAIVCMDGTIEYINRRSVETLGYLPEDIPDMARWWQLAYPDPSYRAEVVAQWMGLLEMAVARQDREIERREYRVTCKDGTLKTMIIFGVLVSGKVFVMFEDITERTRAEEARLGLERQLLHAQKLESLGVLAGGVAHDFNNLLMAMLGNMDLALAQLSAESPAAGNVHQAMAAARMAAGLTNRMLAYSGRGAFVVEAMDLNAVIEENAAMLRAAIARTATLSLQLRRDLPLVTADAAQVQQVVMNLITNASESLGDRAGSVVLSTGVQDCDERYLRRSCLEEQPAPGSFVWLEVADTGCGMSAETVHRLFDPFFTTKFAGRGLGMSAVLGIVRGHRGAIVVDSSPGAGTTIRVLFPVGAAGQEFPQGGAPKAAQLPPPALSGLALIVDDEALVVSVCKAMVKQLGLRSLTAVDGADALRIFRQEGASISVVLLDMTMPQLDGLATFRELRRIRPDVSVILCSGFSEQEIAERFAGEGLAGFLQKPYDLKRLQKVLRKVLPTERS